MLCATPACGLRLVSGSIHASDTDIAWIFRDLMIEQQESKSQDRYDNGDQEAVKDVPRRYADVSYPCGQGGPVQLRLHAGQKAGTDHTVNRCERDRFSKKAEFIYFADRAHFGNEVGCGP